jgi:hypothetical protein
MASYVLGRVNELFFFVIMFFICQLYVGFIFLNTFCKLRS